MKNKTKIILYIFILLLIFSNNTYAFWLWTPETNKWVNPKYAVKDTPAEQLTVGLDLFKEESYNKAINEFKKLIKHYPRSREAPEAQYHIALSLEKQDKLYDAYKQFQLVIEKYPFSDRSADVVQKQFDIASSLIEQRKKRNKFVRSFSVREHEIIDMLRSVIKNAPYSDLAPLAQYKIAVYMEDIKMFEEARDEYEKVINDYPESEWAKAARYRTALADSKLSTDAAYDQKVTQSAVDELKDFVADYPSADLAQDAQSEISKLREKEAENNFLIADFYLKQKNYNAAKIYYQSVVDDYRDTSWTSKALKKISEIIQLEK